MCRLQPPAALIGDKKRLAVHGLRFSGASLPRELPTGETWENFPLHKSEASQRNCDVDILVHFIVSDNG